VAVHPGRQGARTRGRGSRGLRCTGRPGVRGGRGGAGGLNRRFPLGRRWFAGDWRLLVSIAVVLSIEMRSLLIGESASPRVVRAIERALTAQDGIEHLIHLRTMHLGPEELLVADKIGVNPPETAARLAVIIDAVPPGPGIGAKWVNDQRGRRVPGRRRAPSARTRSRRSACAGGVSVGVRSRASGLPGRDRAVGSDHGAWGGGSVTPEVPPMEPGRCLRFRGRGSAGPAGGMVRTPGPPARRCRTCRQRRAPRGVGGPSSGMTDEACGGRGRWTWAARTCDPRCPGRAR